MNWTSRERVITAINHHEPDRVPIDITPLKDFYLLLKQHLGINIAEEIKPNLAMEVIPHPRVLETLGVDMISVKLSSNQKPASAIQKEGFHQDTWGVIYKNVGQPAGGSYWEVVHSPLANATLAELDTYPWPEPHTLAQVEPTRSAARTIFETTDLAIVGRFGGPILETATYLTGFERLLVAMASEPEFVTRLLDKITGIQIVLDRIGLEATGKYLQIFKVSGEDLGMQTGPLFSPRMFRALLLPHLKRRWLAGREFLNQVNPKAKIMLHSCGSVRNFIPDLLDAGIQILDPLQPHARGMDSAELKKEFGDRLTFHGGVDIQEVLPFGTPAQVRAEVQKRVRDYAPGGGFILAPSHNIQADTPPENIITMIEAAKEYGRYPIG